jgi:regulator of telomere elongation helicase 1
MNGEQWYLSEAIRSINQGIGRIIRHKKDFGKIYLLDERYEKEKPDLKSQISSWAKNSLKIVSKYSDLADDFKRAKDA